MNQRILELLEIVSDEGGLSKISSVDAFVLHEMVSIDKNMKNSSNGMRYGKNCRINLIPKYNLKYGSIDKMKKIAKNLSVPLVIERNSVYLPEMKNFHPCSVCDNVGVKMEPFFASMPILIHEITHFFAFQNSISDDNYKLLIRMGKIICDENEYDNLSLAAYKENELKFNYTDLQHEYAAIAAETWSNDDDVYNEIINSTTSDINVLFKNLYQTAKLKTKKIKSI